jgi:predicted  nucleic acid-binding Zn-ribbon protein
VNELEALYRIQEVDNHILALRHREENHALKVELEELEERKKAIETGLEEASASLEESRRKQRGMEDKVQAVDEKLGREEGKLYDGKVTSPKELRGLEAEVRSLKRKKDELETELLEEMEVQDTTQSGFDGLKSDLERLQAEIDEKKSVLDREIAGIGSELAQQEQERDELRSQLDGDLLELYDELLENKHNLAVVKVIEGVCQGCRVELPGIEFDRFLKSDGVFNCTNCGRILMK